MFKKTRDFVTPLQLFAIIESTKDREKTIGTIGINEKMINPTLYAFAKQKNASVILPLFATAKMITPDREIAI